ncbi:MAG: alkaline phosphatase family protein [Myxococcota bacterium]
MKSIYLFALSLVISLSISGCTEESNHFEDATGDAILTDTDIEDILKSDISLQKNKSVKVSVRSRFPSSKGGEEIRLITFSGSDSIIPEESEYTDSFIFETDKIFSISLNNNEGILAFIDKNGSGKLDSGDYFGILKASEIEDGGRYILYIQSYIPFERNLEQGLNGNEIAVFGRIRDKLSEADGLSMIITKIGDEYYVYSKIGTISFKRIFENGEYKYPVNIISGKNPIDNTDAKLLYTFEEELNAGSNPEGTQYSGYEVNDRRISFIEEDKTSYPFAYERIAQIFDDPNSGDIIGLPMPYGDGLYEIGAHGHLDITQSRAPLIFSGAGVRKGLLYENPVKAVDIAPTIIRMMGGKTLIGTNKFNQLTDENYLRRQDGDVISDILNGETPEYAIIIVSDGLSHTELQRAFEDESYNIPNIKSLKENGTYFKYGHITNYFSVTIPSHTTIGTGLYAGHHGIVNNLYYLRDNARLLTLIDLGVGPAQYLRDEVETIFEAYHRNFGRYNEKGNTNGRFTASINEPCTRGATYATLESLIYDFASYQYEPLPIIDELRQVTSADNTAVNQMIYLFEKSNLPLPNLVMINLTSTDGAGHIYGPHSDMIKKVLEQTDFRIGKIIELYKKAGIFDRTVFVFTADHGMEIQDRNRSFEYKIDGTDVSVPLLDELNIKYTGGLPFIYFTTMRYEISQPLTTGISNYVFNVFDEDRGFPLKSAKVTISQNENAISCNTDERGTCNISIEFKEGKARLRIEHSSYNFIEEEIEVQR